MKFSYRGSVRISALAFPAILAGCLSVPPAKDPSRLIAPSTMIRAECASQPTHLSRERCANPRILALYQANSTDPMDVAAAYFARREAIAEKMDLNEISETEGAAEMAEARSRANADTLRRQPSPPTVCTAAGNMTVCQ
jgi:hypothetical protein